MSGREKDLETQLIEIVLANKHIGDQRIYDYVIEIAKPRAKEIVDTAFTKLIGNREYFSDKRVFNIKLVTEQLSSGKLYVDDTGKTKNNLARINEIADVAKIFSEYFQPSEKNYAIIKAEIAKTATKQYMQDTGIEKIEEPSSTSFVLPRELSPDFKNHQPALRIK